MQRPGHWIQEQKLVGAGAARKLASSVPPAADAALMGRSEDRGRVGGGQPRRSLYPDPTGTLMLDGLRNRAAFKVILGAGE